MNRSDITKKGWNTRRERKKSEIAAKTNSTRLRTSTGCAPSISSDAVPAAEPVIIRKQMTSEHLITLCKPMHSLAREQTVRNGLGFPSAIFLLLPFARHREFVRATVRTIYSDYHIYDNIKGLKAAIIGMELNSHCRIFSCHLAKFIRSNIKLVDALVNVTSNKESLAVKRRSYEVLLSCEDGALSSILPLNSDWLLPIIIDLLRACEDDEHRDFFRQVLDRLFVKLNISPSLDDVKTLRNRIGNFSDMATGILLKKETQSSNLTMDVLAVVIKVFSPLFAKGIDIDLVNSVSNLCKRGFESTNTSTMLKAYKAWRGLIGAFALTKDWSNHKIEVTKKDEQFLTMLLKPITFKAKFTDVHIVLEKFETWVVLVNSVGRRLQHVFHKLVVPLFLYCFGCTFEICKRDTVDATVELLTAPITEKCRLFVYCESKMEERHFVPVPKLYIHAIRLLNALLLTNGELSHAFSTPRQVTEFSVLMAQCLRRIASIISVESNEVEFDERQEIQASLPNLWFALTVRIFNMLEASDELEVQRRLLFTQISAFCTVDAVSTPFIDESLLAIAKFKECAKFISSIAPDRIKNQMKQPDNNVNNAELVETNSMENSTEQPGSVSNQLADAKETRNRKRKSVVPLSEPDEDLSSTTITLCQRRTRSIKKGKMTVSAEKRRAEKKKTEKIENSTVLMRNLTNTTRIPVFARNAKKLAVKGATKLAICDSSSIVSSSAVASNVVRSEITVSSDGSSNSEQPLQSQTDGICAVCRESFMKSVVVSPLTEDCALDLTQIKDGNDVNAGDISLAISLSLNDDCADASGEVELVNIDINGADERERFANSQSDEIDISSTTMSICRKFPLNMLNNTAVTNSNVNALDLCMQQSQRHDEPITLMLCQKLAQHLEGSKGMLEGLKSRDITTVKALCRLSNTELDQLHIRKETWKTLQEIMQYDLCENLAQLTKSIQTMDPALISQKAWEDIRNKCCMHAADIIRHFSLPK